MPNHVPLALIVVLALASATAPAKAFPAQLIAPVDASQDIPDSVVLVRKGKGGKGDDDERYERHRRHESRWYPRHRRHSHSMRAMHRHYGYGNYSGRGGNQNQPDGQN